MKLIKPVPFVTLAALCFGMAGCSVLSPKANMAQFYVLRGQSAETTNTATSVTMSEIRVGPGRIAAYLENAQIAVEDGPNRIIYLDNDRWAEPLPKGLSRVLAENLTYKLGASTSSIYPNPPLTDSGYEVQYTVERFEGRLNGPVVLVVSWQVVEMPSSSVIAVKRSVYSIPAQAGSDSVVRYVGRLSAALGQWSEDVAATIPLH